MRGWSVIAPGSSSPGMPSSKTFADLATKAPFVSRLAHAFAELALVI
jgi:hypothetical protein